MFTVTPVILLSACGGGGKEAAGAAEEDTPGGEGREIVVTREQYISSGMSLATVDTADFFIRVHANGYIRALPQHQAVISPYQGGFVRSVRVLPGTRVRKGEALVTLANPAYVTLQQNYLETMARLDYLKKDYERQKKLSEENIASLKNLQRVESDYTMMLAKYKGLKEQLRLLNIPPEKVEKSHFSSTVTIFSPIDGVVEKVSTVLGAYVSPEDVIIRITDPEAIHLELDIYENDVLKVRKGQKILFHRPGDNEKIYSATIYLTGSTVDGQTRTVKVFGKIEDRNIPLLQGMYVEADVLTGRSLSTYLPEKAVVQEGERYLVLMKTGVRDGDLLFRRVEVKTGRNEGGRIEILNPEVLGGHEVLVKGAFFLL